MLGPAESVRVRDKGPTLDTDILALEYGQQYDQYRWIGQMQAAVLTFYGVVAAISLAAVAALRPEPFDPAFLLWVGLVMIAVGLLGCLVGIGVLKSREMQARTQAYLICLLLGMVEAAPKLAEDPNLQLRYRNLLSGGGTFSLMNTMNLVIVIALASGETLLVSGAAVVSVSLFDIDATVAVVGPVLLVVVWIASIILVRQQMKSARSSLNTDFERATERENLDCLRPTFITGSEPRDP